MTTLEDQKTKSSVQNPLDFQQKLAEMKSKITDKPVSIIVDVTTDGISLSKNIDSKIDQLEEKNHLINLSTRGILQTLSPSEQIEFSNNILNWIKGFDSTGNRISTEQQGDKLEAVVNDMFNKKFDIENIKSKIQTIFKNFDTYGKYSAKLSDSLDLDTVDKLSKLQTMITNNVIKSSDIHQEISNIIYKINDNGEFCLTNQDRQKIDILMKKLPTIIDGTFYLKGSNLLLKNRLLNQTEQDKFDAMCQELDQKEINMPVITKTKSAKPWWKIW